ncbi:MAG: UDP-N-acetylmuramoyl-L-alanine--D-glutamate ligase [Candidatus Berkelbacteria bacterium]
MNFENKKVAVIGLWVEGVAMVDFLSQKGAKITILDRETEEDYRKKMPADLGEKIVSILADENISRIFGPQYLDNLDQYDMVFRSPAVYFDDPKLVEAKKSGVCITSQIDLFFDLCPCPIVGITGTKGKGTTASLVYEILKNNFQFPITNYQSNSNVQMSNGKSEAPAVYLAGNIGYPAISLIDKLKSEDIVILELSNFQLADLQKSPHIAVFTNLGVDHLDYHQSEVEYRKAKFNIFQYQTENDFAVINADSSYDDGELNMVKSRKLYFSKSKNDVDATIEKYMNTYAVFLHEDGRKEKICDLTEIKLLGRHNLENIAAAALAARLLNIDLKIISSAVKEFIGLPHRLEFVREIDGVTYVNDSFATNPGPTIAAIESFESPKILILGGSSKGADFSEMAKVITQNNVKAVVVIGAEGPKIRASLLENDYIGQIIDGVGDIDEIVKQSKAVAVTGDVVLFSPACASFDMFKNYKDRGERFKDAVNKIADSVL